MGERGLPVQAPARSAFAGDAAAQRALFDAHKRVRDRSPFGLKQAMADRFGTSPAARMG